MLKTMLKAENSLNSIYNHAGWLRYKIMLISSLCYVSSYVEWMLISSLCYVSSYVEWFGAVWSYNKCWKLCLKLVEFRIQSCRSVLCAVFHVDQFCVLFFIRSQRSIIPAQWLNRVFRVQFERNQFIQLFGSASKGLQYLLNDCVRGYINKSGHCELLLAHWDTDDR